MVKILITPYSTTAIEIISPTRREKARVSTIT